MKKLVFIFLLLHLNTSQVLAQNSVLPKSSAVPGGISVIDLGQSASRPQVYFNKKRVLVKQHNGTWHAIVGLPLSLKQGIHKIKIKSNNKTRYREFSVHDKEYASQHLTVKKKYVGLSKENLERYQREKKVINKALNTWREQDDVQTGFSLPVEGRFSSPFGLRRFFNDKPRKPHSGLDIAAPIGTPIKAPSPGLVVNTGNYFFNGNSVFIEHGQGLITMYFHMNEIKVSKGELVKQGDIIGTVGKSGRVTGPHLHWSVSLNNTRVEPKLFLTEQQ